MYAVPCVPQHVEAQVECESGAVAVSWEPSKGASSYAAVAQGNGGYESTCNSSDTTCLFEELLCGQNYSITVHASDGSCSSAASSPVEIYTGIKNTQIHCCSLDRGYWLISAFWLVLWHIDVVLVSQDVMNKEEIISFLLKTISNVCLKVFSNEKRIRNCTFPTVELIRSSSSSSSSSSIGRFKETET